MSSHRKEEITIVFELNFHTFSQTKVLSSVLWLLHLASVKIKSKGELRLYTDIYSVSVLFFFHV